MRHHHFYIKCSSLNPPSSYRFLLVFEGGPELLQLRWDQRARQLQGLDDVTSVAHLVLCDEGVGVALEGDTHGL